MIHCYFAYAESSDPAYVVAKIGYTNKPERRLDELNTESWLGVTGMEVSSGRFYSDGRHIEKFLHKFLRGYAIHHEWFAMPPEVLVKAQSAVQEKYGEVFVLVTNEERDFCGFPAYFPTEFPTQSPDRSAA